MSATTLRRLLAALFFVSGLSSLILESVWVRMMILVFGSTTFAISTVLTAFMGGLALGSWLAGRRAERLANPRRALAIYGLLELGIGLYSLALPAVMEALPSAHAALWGSLQTTYYLYALLRFLLAATLLLIPTVAMGATLPVLARFYCVADDPTAAGKSVGSLYAINTFGAVLGVFLAGFVLLPTIGMRATNLSACLADLALAGLAYLLWRTAEGGEQTRPDTDDDAPQPVRPASLLSRVTLFSLVLSGAISMVYQIAWTRALSLVIGSSTYAFSLILICFLLGLAGGAAIYAQRHTANPDQASNLSLIHLLVALTAFAGISFIDRFPALLLAILKTTVISPHSLFMIQFLLAGVIIIIPTLFMGMLFPAVIRIYADGGQTSAARTTGDVYAVNTLGSILGSFSGGFLLIPLLGLQVTLNAMVLLGLCLAALFGLFAARRRARFTLLAAAALLAALSLGLGRPWDLKVMSSGVFRISRYADVIQDLGQEPTLAKDTPQQREQDRWRQTARRLVTPALVFDTGYERQVSHRLIEHREGITTTVGITRSVDESLSAEACWVRHALLVNGKVDASLSVLHPRPGRGCIALREGPLPSAGVSISASGDTETQILSGLLPIALHRGEAPPQDALVIGWGSGITLGAALQSPLKRLVAVELELEVVRSTGVFEPHNHIPQRDPRLSLINDDGRNYLSRSPRRYDVIISEPSNPWIAGCGNLFTREFFQLVRSRLKRGGVYLQWLQAYEISPQNVWSILGTLADEFGTIHVFSPVRASSDLLIVAQERPGISLSWEKIQRRMSEGDTSAELERIGILNPGDLLVRLIASTATVQEVSRGAPRNTDDNARIEFATPKDLVNYHAFSPAEITGTLRGKQSALGQILPLTDQDRESLCWAALRAGRLKDARLLPAAKSSPGRSGCHATAALLQEEISAPTAVQVQRLLAGDPRAPEILRALASPEDVVNRLHRTFQPPGDQALPFALLGHSLATQQAQNDLTRRDSLLYLLAASLAVKLRPEDAPRYPPLRRLLARQYWSYAQFRRAVKTLTNAPLELPAAGSSPRSVE